MDYYAYLNPVATQIIRDLISAKFFLHENIGLCNNKDVFGFVQHPKLFVICTKNIRNGGWDMSRYVNETVFHEALHAAQKCNRDQPIGLPIKSMPLPWNKLQDIKKSIRTIGNYSSAVQREHEAFYFEDKPDQVRAYVRKYCF